MCSSRGALRCTYVLREEGGGERGERDGGGRREGGGGEGRGREREEREVGEGAGVGEKEGGGRSGSGREAEGGMWVEEIKVLRRIIGWIGGGQVRAGEVYLAGEYLPSAGSCLK